MLIDANDLPQGHRIKTDVCVVGGGVAGLSLASELAGSGRDVCVLESGGFEYDETVQHLSRGENAGMSYYDLDACRKRGLGGSSRAWGNTMSDGSFAAHMRPLEDLDFKQRDWLPHSGWPFPKSHLNKFYQRAHALCGMGELDYDLQRTNAAADTPLELSSDELVTQLFTCCSQKVFNETLVDKLSARDNVGIHYHATVTELLVAPDGRSIRGLVARTLSGHQVYIRAKRFVLAVGGIEVPRILLLCDRQFKHGIGNEHGLVGRYFTEHLCLWQGKLVVPELNSASSLCLYFSLSNNSDLIGKLATSDDAQTRYGMSAYTLQLNPRPPWQAPLKITFKNVGKVVRREPRYESLWLNHIWEQAPNPGSRVMLSEQRDSLGLRRAKLDWQIAEQDLETYRKSVQIVDTVLRESGVGHLDVQADDEAIIDGLHGGRHHMGTTRMHEDPQRGVVDPDCRVHSMSNLYIASSSVFPTGGSANPTLTIIALAIRLADHLKTLN